MSRYLTEVIGTFFLVLTIALVGASGTALAPIAIGAVLMAMVYMGGHISGAHYNPAVSLAMVMQGKLSGSDFAKYTVCQVLGATLASFTAMHIAGQTFSPQPGSDAGMLAVLLAEFLFTFALVLVVLQVATSPKTEGNSYYGLAIGVTVAAGAFAVDGISGAAFNPAVGIGPTLVDTLFGAGSPEHLWVYIVMPLLGGAAATGVFRLQGEQES